MTVSKRHIEFHPILYDSHNRDIPLMLYVRCLSLNPIKVRTEDEYDTSTFDLGKDSKPHLVRDGDVLFFSSYISLRIDHRLMLERVLTDRQREELQVSFI